MKRFSDYASYKDQLLIFILSHQLSVYEVNRGVYHNIPSPPPPRNVRLHEFNSALTFPLTLLVQDFIDALIILRVMMLFLYRVCQELANATQYA